MRLLAELHGALVFDRRTQVLSDRLAALLPQNARVLDVGCGNGLIDSLIAEHYPGKGQGFTLVSLVTPG